MSADQGFKRLVRVTPAMHRVHSDPVKDYGVTSCEMVFVLRGPLGAISYEVLTGWMLPKTWAWWEKRRHMPGDAMYGHPRPDSKPFGGGLFLHAATFSSEHDHRVVHEPCEWVAGPCWTEIISYQRGDALMARLIAKGDRAVWMELRMLYDRHLAEIPDARQDES
jgi:hypothetical protein